MLYTFYISNSLKSHQGIEVLVIKPRKYCELFKVEHICNIVALFLYCYSLIILKTGWRMMFLCINVDKAFTAQFRYASISKLLQLMYSSPLTCHTDLQHFISTLPASSIPASTICPVFYPLFPSPYHFSPPLPPLPYFTSVLHLSPVPSITLTSSISSMSSS